MLALAENSVCHRPDGLEVKKLSHNKRIFVCHRPDGLEDLALI